jgi:hypothetical protein
VGLFQPITNTSHLPQVGTSAENLALDIKMTVDPGAYFELAKDVAAFANASGGVILVGAAEDRRRGSVGRYMPMEQDEAKRVRDAFNQATRDLCSPKPMLNPVIIACQDKFVVAINVWPFPGQAVGVQLQTELPGFAFPFRTGVETIWLNAEQLPMLMVPELRRISILLDAIPTGARIGILGPRGHVTDEFTLVELRVLENVVVLEQGGRTSKTHLPIDAIRSVWKTHSGLRASRSACS